jgi:hypothetical protein
MYALSLLCSSIVLVITFSSPYFLYYGFVRKGAFFVIVGYANAEYLAF